MLDDTVKMEDVYEIDISYNKISSLKRFEDYFPKLTVLDVSYNDIFDQTELEFMIYLETMAEIDVEGNGFFAKGTEKLLHDQFSFLERINDRNFYSPGERERKMKEEIILDMLKNNLMSNEEARQLREQLQEKHKYDDKLEIHEPEGEYDLLELSVFDRNPEKGKKFFENNKSLIEFAENSVKDFEKKYTSFYKTVDRIEANIFESQTRINRDFEIAGMQGPFNELQVPFLKRPSSSFNHIIGKMDESGLIEQKIGANSFEKESKLKQETPSTSEIKKDSEKQVSGGTSVFETKPSSSSNISEPKGFRLRTYSKDVLSRRSEKDRGLSSSKVSSNTNNGNINNSKIIVNWAQKDLKKQNEDIMKMLERNRLDLGPLQRVPRKIVVAPARKLG